MRPVLSLMARSQIWQWWGRSVIVVMSRSPRRRSNPAPPVVERYARAGAARFGGVLTSVLPVFCRLLLYIGAARYRRWGRVPLARSLVARSRAALCCGVLGSGSWVLPP